jgi:hypothetical protein
MFSFVCVRACVRVLARCCFVPQILNYFFTQNSELFLTMYAVLQMDWLLHRPK